MELNLNYATSEVRGSSSSVKKNQNKRPRNDKYSSSSSPAKKRVNQTGGGGGGGKSWGAPNGAGRSSNKSGHKSNKSSREQKDGKSNRTDASSTTKHNKTDSHKEVSSSSSSSSSDSNGNGSNNNNNISHGKASSNGQNSSSYHLARSSNLKKLPTLKKSTAPSDLSPSDISAKAKPVGGAVMQLIADTSSFAAIGCTENLVVHLEGIMHLKKPTKIQALAVPVIRAGSDALIKSQTGSGKTLAYLLPVIMHLSSLTVRLKREDGTKALVLSPTRELGIQIMNVIAALFKPFHWIIASSIMGGENKKAEKSRLRKGLSVVVGTPGRVLDHLENTRCWKHDRLKWLILDEADRLLDMGFEKDLNAIVKHLEDGHNEMCPPRQTVLVSATLDHGVNNLMRFLTDPVTVGFDKNEIDINTGKPLRIKENAKAEKKDEGNIGNDEEDGEEDDGDEDGEDEDGEDENVGEEDSDEGGKDEEDEDGEDAEDEDGEDAEDDDDDDDAHDKDDRERKTSKTTRQIATVKSATHEKVVMPSELVQQYVQLESRHRLVALASLLRWRIVAGRHGGIRCKIIVFVSTCASVDFHHKIFSHTFWPDFESGAVSSRKAVKNAATTAAAVAEGENDGNSSDDGDTDSGDKRSAKYGRGGKARERHDQAKKGDTRAGKGKGVRMDRRGGKAHGANEGQEEDEDDEDKVEDNDDKKRTAGADEEEKDRFPLLDTQLWKLHGNMDQGDRVSTYKSFCKASEGILFCTDVAARGLDLPAVDWIVQYDAPEETADYIHRVGRTARMGSKGQAMLFLLSTEVGFLDTLATEGIKLQAVPLPRVLGGLHVGLNEENSMRLKAVAGGGQGQGHGNQNAQSGNNGNASLPAGAILQRQFEAMVAVDKKLGDLAKEAYLSYVRAYAAYPKPLKHIFHPKKLHLGHVARNFALTEPPTAIGASAKAPKSKHMKPEEIKMREQKAANAPNLNKMAKKDEKKAAVMEFM